MYTDLRIMVKDVLAVFYSRDLRDHTVASNEFIT